MRDLLRVAEPRIDPIQQDRSQDRQPEAPGDGHEDDLRPLVARWPLRHHRLIEDAQVRDAALSRQTRLVVPLMQVRVQRFRGRDVPLQARLLDHPRRDLPQLLRARVDQPIQLAPARAQLAEQHPGEPRDHGHLEGVHLRDELLHVRMLVGIAVAERAQLRPLGGQLRQRPPQLRRLLHRRDHLQRLDRQGRVARGGQCPLDRIVVPLDLLLLELHLEVLRERRVLRRRHARRDREPAIRRQRDGLDAERLERDLRLLQVLPRDTELLVQDLRQLVQPRPLQIGRDLHQPVRNTVHRCRDLLRVRAEESNAQEVALLRVHVRAEALAQPPRRITRVRHGECDPLARGHQAGCRDPLEPEVRADRVAEHAAL